MECISKGKARAPYEFGCNVSIATNLHRAKGGHFLLQARALHGNPYNGHTLQVALDDIQNIVGRSPLRAGSRIQRAPPHRPSAHCGVHHRAQTRRHRQDQTLVKAPRGRLLQRSARRRWFQSPATPPLPEQCPLFFARVFICALGRLRSSSANPGHSLNPITTS